MIFLKFCRILLQCFTIMVLYLFPFACVANLYIIQLQKIRKLAKKPSLYQRETASWPPGSLLLLAHQFTDSLL